MKINRQELLETLKTIKPALSTKDIVENSNTFIFTKNEIITFNDKMSIGIGFETDFECLVPADEFYKLLTEIDSENIDFKIKDDKLLFNTGKIKASLSVHPIDEEILKTIRPDSKLKWNKLPEDFSEGLSLCAFSTSKDMTHPALTCVNVNENEIISSDNLRISLYKLSEPVKDSFLIPASSVQELVKFEITRYCLQDSWVYFKSRNKVTFCSRTVESEFPDCSHLLDVKGIKFKLPKDIKKSIKISSIMADGNFDIDKKIDVELSDGKIKCKGQNQSGWVESEAELSYKKDDIKFSINPDFFSHILDKATTACHNGNVLLFRSGNFKHLISLFEEEE